MPASVDTFIQALEAKRRKSIHRTQNAGRASSKSTKRTQFSIEWLQGVALSVGERFPRRLDQAGIAHPVSGGTSPGPTMTSPNARDRSQWVNGQRFEIATGTSRHGLVPGHKVPWERAMSPHDLLSSVQAHRFRPFAVRMASGRTFEIGHPELVRVGKTGVVVFTYASAGPDVYDRWETVSLAMIDSIAHWESSVA